VGTWGVAQFAAGFRQLREPGGFSAKWGPTTTERRHSCYNFTTDAQCNWNGGVWPFETSKAGAVDRHTERQRERERERERESWSGVVE
jgi:hypothetical protein